MRRRLVSESHVDKEYFNSLIEQQKVDDITIGVFYRSRTLTVLAVIWLCLAYFAFSRSPIQSLQYNLFHAFIAVCVIFLLISVMIMPNGPFTRPHPALWRIVFGASLLYFLCLVAVVFLRLDEARAILIWIYPELKHMRHSDILDKEYAVNCSQISLARVYSHMDIFALAHFFGWLIKAILLRHHIIAWTLSINWEITEVAFSHILPNFNECWWDSLILDILVCNGLGIQCGMWLCRWLEMRDYKWDSIRNIPSASGKLKRAFLQFTPRRQYYLYVIDPHIKRVGSQLWLFISFLTVWIGRYLTNSHPCKWFRSSNHSDINHNQSTCINLKDNPENSSHMNKPRQVTISDDVITFESLSQTSTMKSTSLVNTNNHIKIE
ncbi:Phosphatidylserine synthase 1 [Schistosoma japonicum]|nr:Phosphatidylserine synthase 1 [Schistosoma japonicum]